MVAALAAVASASATISTVVVFSGRSIEREAACDLARLAQPDVDVRIAVIEPDTTVVAAAAAINAADAMVAVGPEGARLAACATLVRSAAVLVLTDHATPPVAVPPLFVDCPETLATFDGWYMSVEASEKETIWLRVKDAFFVMRVLPATALFPAREGTGMSACDVVETTEQLLAGPETMRWMCEKERLDIQSHVRPTERAAAHLAALAQIAPLSFKFASASAMFDAVLAPSREIAAAAATTSPTTTTREETHYLSLLWALSSETWYEVANAGAAFAAGWAKFTVGCFGWILGLVQLGGGEKKAETEERVFAASVAFLSGAVAVGALTAVLMRCATSKKQKR